MNPCRGLPADVQSRVGQGASWARQRWTPRSGKGWSEHTENHNRYAVKLADGIRTTRRALFSSFEILKSIDKCKQKLWFLFEINLPKLDPISRMFEAQSKTKGKKKKKKNSGPWGILEFAYLFSVLKTLFCFSFDKDKTLCNIRCSLCPEVCFKIKVEHWLLAAQSIMDHERRTKFLYCRLQKSVSFWTPNREQCTH